jgi:hypothetical protein
LRYGCAAAFLPFLVAIVLIVAFAVVSGLGPEHVVTHFMDGNDVDIFLTGSSCTDALGCVTVVLILLGPLPYGLLYGMGGFIFGELTRFSGVDFMRLQDPLVAAIITILIWAGSILTALRRR